MDTKPLEHEALNQIKALLSLYNYKFVEMNFDENGADIFIVKEEECDSTLFLKCIKGQSKGRNITKCSSEVVIPCRYVSDNFIAFVYVKKECEEENEAKTYLFSADEIRNYWKRRSGDYVLYLPQNFNYKKDNEQFLFNKKRSAIIDDILNKVGESRIASDINILSESEFYFEMWRKTGGLPSYEYIKDVFKVGFSDGILFSGKFVFILCASLIVNHDIADIDLSIDWAFNVLRYFEIKNGISLEYKKGETVFTNVAITYGNTWVQEILSNECDVIGYHLHIGDKEEAVDAIILKDGEYSIEYSAVSKF